MSLLFEYTSLGDEGRLDQKPLIHMVRQHFFGLILIGESPQAFERAIGWPQQFASSLFQIYYPVAHFSCAYANFAYEPNSTPGPVSGSHGK